jgi:hypothetical protein
MQIQRPTADIAYVIADAHGGRGVRLDQLRFGPEAAVATNSQGAYAIPGLVAGRYFVEAVSPSGLVLADSRREVTLAEGESLGSVDFIAHTGTISWQNPVRPADVNDDGDVTALDALVLINFINDNSGSLSVPSDDVPPPYLDVDGNGSVTAADALVIINHLNYAATSFSGAGGESPASSFAEGESPDGGGLAMLSPSSPAPLTVPPTRTADDTHPRTTRHLFDGPGVSADAAPSWSHHRTSSAVRSSPIRVADEVSRCADLEDFLDVLADDVTSRAGASFLTELRS